MWSVDDAEVIYNWSDTDGFIYPKIELELTSVVSSPIIKQASPAFAGLEDFSKRTDMRKLYYASNSLINIHNSSDDNTTKRDLNLRGLCYGMKALVDCKNCFVENYWIMSLVPLPLIVSFDNSAAVENQNYIRLVKGENAITVSGIYNNLKITFNCERYLI